MTPWTLSERWSAVAIAALGVAFVATAAASVGGPPAEAPRPDAPREAPKRGVSGRVVGEDGRGIAGVAVKAFTRAGMTVATATSAEGGAFGLSPLEPGLGYDVLAVAPGFAPSLKRKVVLSSESIVIMMGKGKALAFEVVEWSETGWKPIGGATVKFQIQGSAPDAYLQAAEHTTDAEGRVTFLAPPEPWKYRIRAHKQVYEELVCEFNTAEPHGQLVLTPHWRH